MRKLLTYTFVLALTATWAQAACFADYKAKQDNPLRLHYGVAEISGGNCTAQAAKRQLDDRLQDRGWQLLNVLSVFDEQGLSERKESAGEFFLRF
ncbi:hypothetical protein [Parasulfitobacter algicola]|uniref:DUF4177 domain-containing protein n=1 Tax=Parasulfitobacter algicola TaxID=2614809 RepID=A0ABX2ILX0_9RHOB|nr:hypothetical protein [Sulfitobacter algicola]NSX53375.1 hypothetical protein [Sulfitobacter algicola]